MSDAAPTPTAGPTPAARPFLDANVLLGAAWTPAARLRRLWDLAGVTLVTGGTTAAEAVRNAINKRPADPERLGRLAGLLMRCERVADARDDGRPLAATLAGWPAAAPELPDKDRPVLLAAAACGATHLLTGDKQHFGPLFGHRVGGVLVLPPPAFLARLPPDEAGGGGGA